MFKIIIKHIAIFKKLYFEENCLLRHDTMYLVKIYHFRGTFCPCLQGKKLKHATCDGDRAHRNLDRRQTIDSYINNVQ
jgi:hypothetical protein